MVTIVGGRQGAGITKNYPAALTKTLRGVLTIVVSTGLLARLPGVLTTD